ncbi:guanylate kinase [Chloroflexota bacterium]
MKESSPISNNLSNNPILLVLSGPSGVGKDAILNRMRERNLPVYHVTTLTTRQKRTGEKDKREYHFIPWEKFQDMIENNLLLEWAEVYGNLYGVPKEPIKRSLEQGQDVIVKVDIQGASTIKKLVPQVVTIFLIPPSMDELLKRLTGRRTESPADLDLRLKTAEDEMKQISHFDYTVVNKAGEIDKAVSEIEAIITAEKGRITRKKITL